LKPFGAALPEWYALRPSEPVDAERLHVTYTYMMCKKFRDKQ
jgi:hypothetical protein